MNRRAQGHDGERPGNLSPTLLEVFHMLTRIVLVAAFVLSIVGVADARQTQRRDCCKRNLSCCTGIKHCCVVR